VRKAAWLAIDRQAAVTVLGEGDGSYGLMLAPEGKWGLPTSEILKLPGYRQPKDPDLAEAKKLMAEAGYANGVDVVLDTRAGTHDERRATFLKDQLAKIGIRATIRPNEIAKMYQIINAYSYSCVSYPNSLAFDDPDDCFTRYWLPKAQWNRARLKDPKLDECTPGSPRPWTFARRKKLVRELRTTSSLSTRPWCFTGQRSMALPGLRSRTGRSDMAFSQPEVSGRLAGSSSRSGSRAGEFRARIGRAKGTDMKGRAISTLPSNGNYVSGRVPYFTTRIVSLT